MALTDTLSGWLHVTLAATLKRSETSMAGSDKLNCVQSDEFTDGTGSNQATCWLTGTLAVTEAAAIVLSLADDADPLSTAGDAVPTADPEGLKIKVLIIKNTGSTNSMTVTNGTNGIVGILNAADVITIAPGGIFVWMSPAGCTAINDGADDELDVKAITADTTAEIAVVYG